MTAAAPPGTAAFVRHGYLGVSDGRNWLRLLATGIAAIVVGLALAILLASHHEKLTVYGGTAVIVVIIGLGILWTVRADARASRQYLESRERERVDDWRPPRAPRPATPGRPAVSP